MIKLNQRRLPDAFRAVDLGVLAVAFGGALVSTSSAAGASGLDTLLSARVSVSSLLLFVAFAGAWHLVLSAQGLYRPRQLGRGSEWWDVTRACVLGTILLGAASVLLELPIVDRTFLATFGCLALAGTLGVRTGTRLLVSRARRRGRQLRNLVIVGCGPRGAAVGRTIWRQPELGFLLLGYVDDMPPPVNPLHGGHEQLLGALSELGDVIDRHQVDEVFVALPMRSHYETIARIIALGEERGFIVRLPADPFELRLAKAELDFLDGSAVLTLATPRPGAGELALKRGIDLVGSLAALLVLAPVLAAVAAAVKLGSRGPVFFRQERVGLGGRTFRLIKFRTMGVDAEAELEALEALNEVEGAAFKMRDDPRVTPIGRLLRKLSLDELPQFLNVLAGDMSLVGPRPLPVRDVGRFDAAWLKRRFSVKPGLTCLWQVNGRHQIGFQHWMELDLQYIDHWSLKLDCEILAKTLPAVLKGAGAS